MRVFVAVATCALVCISAQLQAETEMKTIMKLKLGSASGPNFSFTSGEFSVLDDGVTETVGTRNANIEFLNYVDPPLSAFSAGQPSFTLTDVAASNLSQTLSGALLIQEFALGNLAIYGADNSLLLEATLPLSAVSAPLSTPNAPGLFSAYGQVIGGSLAASIDPKSLRIKMKLPTISSALSVSPMPPAPAPDVHLAELAPFMATGITIEILAKPPVPEPAAAVLLLTGGALFAAARGGRRR
jgi:hypothetical protein